MVRYTGPKNRVARRFGANVFGRLRNPMLHKPHPPGMHGAKRKKKSDFGLQLEEKQKLRAVYGMISHKQLLRYYKEAVSKEGNTAHLLMQRLECRLDNIVHKMGLASTIFHAHQLISHGHVLVNGKKTTIRSFEVKAGMEIELKDKMQNNATVKQAIEAQRELPEYIEVDSKAFKGKLISTPQFEQVALPLPINVALICEYLAHNN